LGAVERLEREKGMNFAASLSKKKVYRVGRRSRDMALKEVKNYKGMMVL
jgi:hypothetical protein